MQDGKLCGQYRLARSHDRHVPLWCWCSVGVRRRSAANGLNGFARGTLDSRDARGKERLRGDDHVGLQLVAID